MSKTATVALLSRFIFGPRPAYGRVPPTLLLSDTSGSSKRAPNGTAASFTALDPSDLHAR